MADTSDRIPANAIRFDEAFNRLLDADPRTAEVRAELDRLYGAQLHDGPEWDDAYNKLQEIEQDVGRALREALRYGPLKAYQRNSNTGLQEPVPPEDWERIIIGAGDAVTFPPIYFLKSEFDDWLQKIQGNTQKRGRPPKGRDAVKEARIALWGDAPITEEPSAARDKVIQWLNDNKGTFPSDDTILRGPRFQEIGKISESVLLLFAFLPVLQRKISSH
jgi:hypothetical protein